MVYHESRILVNYCSHIGVLYHAEMSTQEKILTIFGAKEMNAAIGNLVQSSVTNWLPVLASYTVVNDDILKPEPGYVLYNITDGIVVTQVSAQFTCWLATP
jgi:hypothetical protein